MEVNATKGSAAADIIAATAKAKNAAPSGESAASMFASAVSAATKGTAHSSGNNNGLGALGGMFSKSETNRDVGSDDMDDPGPGRDMDLRSEEAPAPRQADAPVRDERPVYDDAPDNAPVAVSTQPTAEPEQRAPTEQHEQHADASTTDDDAQQQNNHASGEETADAAPAAAQAAPTVDANAVANAVQAQSNAPQTKNTEVVAAAVVKTEVAAVSSAPQTVAKEAAPAVQAQAQQNGVGAENTKKQGAPTKAAQQTATDTDTDEIVLPQNAAKAKATAKAAVTQSTHQSAAQAKTATDAPAQQAQTQSQTQAQAQELSRRLGGNQRVDVAVTVDKEADTLTSRPTVSLAASATKSAAAAAATGRGNEAGQNGQNMGGNNQNQAQAQMAMQAQVASNQAAARPAGGSGFQAQMNVATTAQVGGAEGASAATAAAGTTLGAATQQAGTALPQKTAKAATPQQMQRAVTEQVSVQIAKAAGNGSDKISIRLNPASLGRIDVQLELGQDGRMTATIVADNKDTFDMLQKDARGLAKALQDAGLNTNSGDLNFSLRGENGADQGQQGSGSGASAAKPDIGLIEQPLEDLLAGGTNRSVITNDRVDIQV